MEKFRWKETCVAIFFMLALELELFSSASARNFNTAGNIWLHRLQSDSAP